MKAKFINLIIFVLVLIPTINAQKVIRNLGFEDLDVVGRLISWEIRNPNNTYQIKIDTTQSHTGKVSLLLQSSIPNAQKRGAANAFSLIKAPNLNQKSSIKITGFIKTEEIEDGTAFIGLQLNGAKGTLTEVNTENKNIRGNTPWTEYSIESPINSDVKSISFGVQITGKGKAWFDDFNVTVDGVNLGENITLKDL
ncbi:hypothetical protein GCM10027566_21920 [Arachidicoccus ginsenosidivorans]|uniref:CBM-cenC domain-containing protein n=1 Tax=Arachidicoccus ginsenosidivorans TaxID=496057 RepID=A0A5B8VM74_9BACT|nr:hypothetical protein [Arachidicoccus ginsenosidivorans]QEC72181.1 hypothetical protein FSB73_11360 [Arachidicoccus ginsenosidivorans]